MLKVLRCWAGYLIYLATTIKSQHLHPFCLVAAPDHWTRLSKKKIFNPIPKPPSIKENTQDIYHYLYLYPHGLRFWFLIFLVISTTTLPILGLLGTASSQPASFWLYFLIGVLQGIIFFYLYRFSYRRNNVPVLSDIWPRWRQERYRLFAPIPYRTYGPLRPEHPEAEPFNDTKENRSHPPRPLGYDAQRYDVLLIAAMREFFKTNPEKQIDPSIERFLRYWFAPSSFGYITLILIFILSLLSVKISGSQTWAIAPVDMLIQGIAWLICSLVFLYQQATFLNIRWWEIRRPQLTIFPTEIKSVLPNSIREFPNTLKGITWRMITTIQALVFAIFLVLLIFYDAAIWKESTTKIKENAQLSLFSFTWLHNLSMPSKTKPKESK